MIEVEGTQAAVEIELFPQVNLWSHFQAVGPADAGQSHGSQQDGVLLPAGGQGLRRQRIAALQESPRPDGEFTQLESDPVQLLLDGLQNPDGLGDNFRPDAVSRQDGNSKYFLRDHGSSPCVSVTAPIAETGRDAG